MGDTDSSALEAQFICTAPKVNVPPTTGYTHEEKVQKILMEAGVPSNYYQGKTLLEMPSESTLLRVQSGQRHPDDVFPLETHLTASILDGLHLVKS